MQLRLFVLADYATVSRDNKLILAGIFDGVNLRRNPGTAIDQIGPVLLPNMYMAAIVHGSISEGLTHTAGFSIRDDDGEDVVGVHEIGQFSFAMNPFGRPMPCQIVGQLKGLALPSPGDYLFQFLVDGTCIGEAAFYVTDVTAEG